MPTLAAKILAFFSSLILLISGFAETLYAPPQAEPLQELLAMDADIFAQIPVGETVYAVSTAGLSFDERNTLQCLQGLVNREKAQLIVPRSALDETYLAAAQAQHGFRLSRTDASGAKWTLDSLLALFLPCITDAGFVLYDNGDDFNGLNMACTIAGARGWLLATPAVRERLEKAGLQLQEDITGKTYNLAFVKKIFRTYKDKLCNSFVVHIEPGGTELRDLAVQQGAFVFYTEENYLGRAFRRSVFSWTQDNAPVLGWASSEIAYVEDASGAGSFVIPSDFCCNLSFYTGCGSAQLLQNRSEKTISADPTKHYAALVLSDGDNAQYIQNGFSAFREKVARADCDFPMTWSFAPLQQRLAPYSASYMYSLAGENDLFIAGCSGAGYMHTSEYPMDTLAGYTALTAATMAKSDMHIVTLLDTTPRLSELCDFTRRLGYFARYENIYGGILQMDPDRYASGKGRVFFANDKPFVSVRLSLWHPSGDTGQVTREWLQEQAQLVNNYPAAVDSIAGYSVINVHPWTISVDDLAYFVSCLDADVELVNAEELLAMLSANVPHKNAVP